MGVGGPVEAGVGEGDRVLDWFKVGEDGGLFETGPQVLFDPFEQVVPFALDITNSATGVSALPIVQ